MLQLDFGQDRVNTTYSRKANPGLRSDSFGSKRDKIDDDVAFYSNIDLFVPNLVNRWR